MKEVEKELDKQETIISENPVRKELEQKIQEIGLDEMIIRELITLREETKELKEELTKTKNYMKAVNAKVFNLELKGGGI